VSGGDEERGKKKVKKLTEKFERCFKKKEAMRSGKTTCNIHTQREYYVCNLKKKIFVSNITREWLQILNAFLFP